MNCDKLILIISSLSSIILPLLTEPAHSQYTLFGTSIHGHGYNENVLLSQFFGQKVTWKNIHLRPCSRIVSMKNVQTKYLEERV